MCEKKVKAGTRKHNKSKLVEKRLFCSFNLTSYIDERK